MQIGYAAAMRIVLLGLVVAIGAKSQAAPILVEVRSDGVLVDSYNTVTLNCAVSGPGEVCNNAAFNDTAGDFTIKSINLSLLTSSIANANIAVQNNDSATHRLTVDIILTVPSTGVLPIETLGTHGGSITDGITTPAPIPGNGSVTISTVLGTSLYTALIDGNPYDTLRDDPYSLTDPASANIPGTNFGLGVGAPNQPGPPIVSTIAIRFDFTLTGEDQAGMQGSFRTEVVPEPGTAVLLGLGLALLARAGRRR